MKKETIQVSDGTCIDAFVEEVKTHDGGTDRYAIPSLKSKKVYKYDDKEKCYVRVK